MTFANYSAITRFMGMDGVEIVMAVEDAFDIRIEDAEAEKVVMPRQLLELVRAKVANVETSICLSHRAFNLLRKYLVQRRAMPRKQITPTAQLGALIPRPQRKLFLHDFAAEIGAGAPPTLARPAWLIGLLVALSLAVGAYTAFAIGADLGNRLVILMFVAVGTAMLGATITRPFRTDFPKNLASAGEFALWIRRHKADLAVKSQKAWTRDQIAERVREIVIDTLGCEKNYREDARFIQDLGLS